MGAMHVDQSYESVDNGRGMSVQSLFYIYNFIFESNLGSIDRRAA